jgi:hypothetical protein
MYTISAPKSCQHDRATHRVEERIHFLSFNKCDNLLKHINPQNPSGCLMYNQVKNYKFLILSWIYLSMYFIRISEKTTLTN